MSGGGNNSKGGQTPAMAAGAAGGAGQGQAHNARALMYAQQNQQQPQAQGGGQQGFGVNPYSNASAGMQDAFQMLNMASNQAQGGRPQRYNAATIQGTRYNPATANAARYDAVKGDAARYNAAQSEAARYAAQMQRGPEQIRDLMRDYQNPYEDQVVRSTSNEVMRNLQQAQMGNADAASAAGAFGGGRHGLVEATTNAEALRDIGDLTGQLRAQGFDTAAGLAGQDISNRMDVRSQNQMAENARRQFNTGNRQQTNMANQAAENARRQFNTANRQDMRLSNMDAENARRQFNTANRQNMRQFNTGNINQARQYGADSRMDARLSNQASRNQARQFNTQNRTNFRNDRIDQLQSIAGGMGNMAQASYGMGRDITNQQNQMGGMAQQLMQQILNQGAGQFGEQASSPEQLLQMRLASLGMNPLNNATTTTTQSNPGWGGMFGNLIGAAGNMLSFNPITLSSLRYKTVLDKTGKKVKSVSGKVVDQVTFVYNDGINPSRSVHIGVVAEELGPDDPAVVVDVYGRPDKVDYSKLEVI